MAKVTLANITSDYASRARHNANYAAMAAAMENTLSRDGSLPNHMTANLDINNKRIINIAQGVNNTDVVNVEQVYDIVSELTDNTEINVDLIYHNVMVENLLALRTYAGDRLTDGQVFYIKGHTTAGDGGGGIFLCTTTTSGTDNNGTLIDSDTIGFYFSRLYDGNPTIEMFGAVGDGIVDDYTAFNNAVNSLSNIKIGPKTYRLSNTLIIPEGFTFSGSSFQPNEVVNFGSTLLFDLAVSPCITLLETPALRTTRLENTTITRAVGAIPASSIGVFINTGYNVILSNICITRHAKNLRLFSEGVNGISCHCTGLYTGMATDVHIELDTWPEFYIDQSRLGSNGDQDFSCTAYVRITGGGIGGAGPNTIYFNQVHLNQGLLTPSYGIEWVNISNTDTNAVEFGFSQCHFEGIGTALFKTDSSCAALNRFSFTDCFVHITSGEIFELDVATQPNDWSIHGNKFYCDTFTLAPTLQFNKVAITNNVILGDGNITAPSSSTLSLSNNNWGSLTLAGAGDVTIFGDRFNAGAFTNNSTGVVTFITPDEVYQSWTPALEFGGLSTGITYDIQQGKYQCIGRVVTAFFVITLSSKGTAVGVAKIGGLPYVSEVLTGAGGSGICYSLGMSALDGPVFVTCDQGTTELNLYESSTTGVSTLTDGHFNNTSVINGTVTYLI